jgi:hypothetical protein
LGVNEIDLLHKLLEYNNGYKIAFMKSKAFTKGIKSTLKNISFVGLAYQGKDICA